MTRKTEFLDSKQMASIIRRVCGDALRQIESADNFVYEFDGKPITSHSEMTSLMQIAYVEPGQVLALGMLRDAARKCQASVGVGVFETIARIHSSSVKAFQLFATGENHVAITAMLDEELASCIAKIDATHRYCSFDDACKYARSRLSNEAVDIASEALALGGPLATIDVHKHIGEGKSVIELIDGYTFNLRPAISLDKAVEWVRTNVKVAVIDGVIESVAEAHSLFDDAYQKKRSLLIVCRGIDEEVASTVVANRMRKTLDVSVVTVAYDALGANLLNDVAVACGCDVVSSLKGELISTLRLEKLPTVESVNLKDGRLSITNQSARSGVLQQIKMLHDKRTENSVPEAEELYDKRIRGLTSLRVDVRINGSSRASQELIEGVDAAIRLIRAAMAWGIDENGVPIALRKQVELQAHRCVRNLCLAAGSVVSS